MAETGFGRAWRFAIDVLYRFSNHDGWAIASHVALSTLLALFPFLIFVTAFASFAGTADVAEEVVDLAFEGWPSDVAEPLTREVTRVLTGRRGDLLTIGVLLTVWISSTAVEALRTALVRAYGVLDPRPWWLTRIQSLGFVFLGAVGLLLTAAALVFWPAAWNMAAARAPWIQEIAGISALARYGVTGIFLTVALIILHRYLPFGRRSIRSVLPGVLFTLLVWIATAALFGFWIAYFANYASTYAGLGGLMAAIVFLQLNAMVFVLGCEINAVLADRHMMRAELRGEATG